MGRLTIRTARRDEARVLTAIAHEAKAHWGYPDEWLQLWHDDLTFMPATFQRSRVFVAERNGRRLGVGAVSLDGDEAEVDHLWVRPEAMGQGVGRALLDRLVQAAQAGGARRLVIVSDPHAVGFYEAYGARRVGEESSSIPGRSLPRLVLRLVRAGG